MRKPTWDEVEHEWLEFAPGVSACVLCGRDKDAPLHVDKTVLETL